jgi:hypothetical protein
VKPVLPPTRVGDLNWPVVSYIRLDTGDVPAEFIVLVDCGEGPPREPYATLRVLVWPYCTKSGLGHHDMSYAQAQRSLVQRAGLLPVSTVEVVTVRDPDRSNDHTVFIDGKARPDGRTDLVQVISHDIDLGASEITPDWAAGQLERTQTLSPAAAVHAREVVSMYADDNDVDGS